MGGDQANLIHVGCQHDTFAVFTLFASMDDQVAKCIHTYFVAEGFDLGSDDLPYHRFVAGRAGCFSEFLDKAFHIFTRD